MGSPLQISNAMGLSVFLLAFAIHLVASQSGYWGDYGTFPETTTTMTPTTTTNRDCLEEGMVPYIKKIGSKITRSLADCQALCKRVSVCDLFKFYNSKMRWGAGNCYILAVGYRNARIMGWASGPKQC